MGQVENCFLTMSVFLTEIYDSEQIHNGLQWEFYFLTLS